MKTSDNYIIMVRMLKVLWYYKNSYHNYGYGNSEKIFPNGRQIKNNEDLFYNCSGFQIWLPTDKTLVKGT